MDHCFFRSPRIVDTKCVKLTSHSEEISTNFSEVCHCSRSSASQSSPGVHFCHVYPCPQKSDIVLPWLGLAMRRCSCVGSYPVQRKRRWRNNWRRFCLWWIWIRTRLQETCGTRYCSLNFSHWLETDFSLSWRVLLTLLLHGESQAWGWGDYSRRDQDVVCKRRISSSPELIWPRVSTAQGQTFSTKLRGPQHPFSFLDWTMSMGFWELLGNVIAAIRNRKRCKDLTCYID